MRDVSDDDPVTASTDSLTFGGEAKSIRHKVVEIGRVVVPVGRMHGWVSIFFLFRSISPNGGRMSRLKLSLRKYQWYKGKWKKRCCYNVNNDNEMRAIYDMIAAYYPHIIPDTEEFQAEDIGNARS